MVISPGDVQSFANILERRIAAAPTKLKAELQVFETYLQKLRSISSLIIEQKQLERRRQELMHPGIFARMAGRASPDPRALMRVDEETAAVEDLLARDLVALTAAAKMVPPEIKRALDYLILDARRIEKTKSGVRGGYVQYKAVLHNFNNLCANELHSAVTKMQVNRSIWGASKDAKAAESEIWQLIRFLEGESWSILGDAGMASTLVFASMVGILVTVVIVNINNINLSINSPEVGRYVHWLALSLPVSLYFIMGSGRKSTA